MIWSYFEEGLCIGMRIVGIVLPTLTLLALGQLAYLLGRYLAQ